MLIQIMYPNKQTNKQTSKQTNEEKHNIHGKETYMLS